MRRELDLENGNFVCSYRKIILHPYKRSAAPARHRECSGEAGGLEEHPALRDLRSGLAALRQEEVMRTPVESHLRWVRYAKFHPDEMESELHWAGRLS
jgi:hypothetical protein